MLPNNDVSTNASCTNCCSQKAVRFQMKGNIFFMRWQNIYQFQLAVFPQYDFEENVSGRYMLACYYRARILPNIDVSTNASYTNCCDQMAAGFQVNWNFVFSALAKYLSILTSRFSTKCLWIKLVHVRYYRFRMLPNYDGFNNVTIKNRCGKMAA